MSGPLIRRACAGDFAEVGDVAVAAYAQFADAVPPSIFAAYVADLRPAEDQVRDAEVLVCEVGGRIAGSVMFYADAALEDLGLPSTWAGFRKLAVHPRCRGSGAGRALVARCVQMARDNGAEAVGIHTASFMTAACRLYEGMGFRRCAEHDLTASDLLGSAEGAADVAVIAYRHDLHF